MSDPSSTADIVNQLNDCELEILVIKEELEQHTGENADREVRVKCLVMLIFVTVNMVLNVTRAFKTILRL